MAIKQVFQNAAGIFRGSKRQSRSLYGSQRPFPGEWPALKSGFSQLDRATGLDGLPQGRITELIGPDSRGCLSIAAKIAAKFQRKQLSVIVIDMVASFELAHVVRCGLVAPELFTYRPQNAFEVINILEQAAKQRGLIILNLGCIPETLSQVPGATLNALLHRLCRIVASSNSVFLCVTSPLDVDPFIHTNYVPGFPINEVADLRLWVQDEGWIKKSQQISGYRGNITVIKNTLAASGKGANIRIPFVDPELMRLSDELGF